MSAPRGYTEVNVSLAKMETVAKNEVVVLLTCDRCGSVVLFPVQHASWHRKRGE